jgi:hypothetical protein
MATDYNPFALDPNNKVIPSAKSISGILNVAINTSTYVAVTVPAATYCKSVLMQTRDGSPFLVSDVLAGTTYATITQPLGIDIYGIPGKVLCYVKATVAGTLEVILLD